MTLQMLTGSRTNPLSAGEQLRLAKDYRRTGDPRIERILVERNLRLVAKIAHQLDRTRGRCLDDLIQEGCLGLIEGVRRFDPTRGVHLSTYAAFWIRALIVKFQMDNVRLVRAVRTRADRAAFFRGSVGIKEVSLDARLAPGHPSLSDLIADPAPRADHRLEILELASKARRSAALLQRRLSDRDVTVLEERLLSEDPTPLRTLARRVSLSRERVRQVEGALRMAIQKQIEARAPAAAA
jgi:RNA polymerase sigma-32 factor